MSTAPAAGVEVGADFEFDVPVRFDVDHMAVTIETWSLHDWRSCREGGGTYGPPVRKRHFAR